MGRFAWSQEFFCGPTNGEQKQKTSVRKYQLLKIRIHGIPLCLQRKAK